LRLHTRRGIAFAASLAALALLFCPQAGVADELKRQGFWGLQVAPVTAEQRARLKLSPGQGVVVKQVAEGIGRWFIDYNLDNARRQLVLRGVPYDEVEREVRLDERCTRRVLVEKQTPEEVLRADPRCADYVRFTQASYAYMQQWADMNPAEKWKAVDAPVLVIYGTSDFLTSGEESRYLTDLINSFHPGAATFVLIEGIDHGLTRAVSQRESMERRANVQPAEFDEEILEPITRWLDEVLKHED
jgi:pimeloyl-ACP methyl ester carboxylesterase